MVAEALACGVPVISTRAGMAHELVQDGVTGFLVDWSVNDIAARLAQIVFDSDLRDRMVLAAPSSVQRFEKSRVVKDYALGYQELVQRQM